MAGPRKLWKTTVVIWSEFDPQTVEIDRLISEGIGGEAYISKQHAELVSDPYSQEDGPPEDFFDSGDDDGEQRT